MNFSWLIVDKTSPRLHTATVSYNYTRLHSELATTIYFVQRALPVSLRGTATELHDTLTGKGRLESAFMRHSLIIIADKGTSIN